MSGRGQVVEYIIWIELKDLFDSKHLCVTVHSSVLHFPEDGLHSQNNQEFKMDIENNQAWYFPTKSGIFPTLLEESRCHGVKWFKTIGRTRGLAARGCADVAPAAMPPPN